MKSLCRYTVLAGLLIAAVFGTPQTTHAQRAPDGSFDRALNVSGPVDLDVTTGSGRISVRAGSPNRVEIRGTIRVGWDWFGGRSVSRDTVRDVESRPPIDQTGNIIRIGRLDGFEYRNISISYEITVPPNTRLRSRTGSGSQEIEGLDGTVEVSTGSGAIRLSNVRNNVSANTGSGQIVAESVKGAFRGHTGSGRISVDGEPTGSWYLETGSGSVVVRLPRQAAFDLDAHSGSGGVSVDHPITVRGRIRRDSVSGTVRGGGVALNIRTGSGGIRVE